ncbi:MAG TPA: site-specific recombinase [Telluria sp.]|nr:site-specific recombinase [Telluria sp.]
MLALLDRIDPDSTNIDMMVELVRALRPRRPNDIEQAAANVRTLTQLLRGNPEHAWRLHRYGTRLLEARRHASLYTDTGILSNDGFVTELKRRISYRILPPAHNEVYLSDALDQVLYKQTDHLWISGVPAADWYDLFQVVASSRGPEDTGNAGLVALEGMLQAIRTLSCRVCALGLEPRLVHSYAEIEDYDSPFLMQNMEVNDYLEAYGQVLAGEAREIEDAKHLLVMLDQCDEVVLKIRRRALANGTTVGVSYLLVALTQSIDRLRKLLYLVDLSGELPTPDSVDLDAVAADVTPQAAGHRQVSRREAAALALALELIEAHNHKYAVRSMLTSTIHLLARNVTENASRTGEHYIAETRKELWQMFRSSAGAGLIVGFMALIKILTGYLRAAPVVEALLFGMNYALGFMLIHVLHFTVATKQPAMTAARLAAELQTTDGKTPDVDSMAVLVNKVFRTQFVAVLGNLATALPTAYAIALAWKDVTGRHLVTADKALHLLKDIDPIGSPALWYAAIAGVWLFVAGLISGYYDNKALYTRMAQRILQLRRPRKLLGPERLARLANYVENNLGGLMGNFFFGMLLGVTGTVGFMLGLPLDIRHVTFSSANFATALVALDHAISTELAARSIAGFLSIGLVNLIVSFSLALWVALRARRISFRRSILLLYALGRRFVAGPVEFFLGPKADKGVQP